MAIFNISNQLAQIDTGSVRTFFYNPTLSPVSIYAGLGENQVLGQRFIGVANVTATNPSGAPAVFMLVQYKSTANPAVAAAPAPVYWTDQTYTTVTGVSTESLLGLNGIAGYLMPNSTDISGFTNTMLNGAQVYIQVAGYLKGAVAPGGAPGVGTSIIGAATNFASSAIASGTAPGQRVLAYQATVVASSACDVLVVSDIV